MEQKIRRRRNSSNLFNPSSQGLTTYDVAYVTAKNNQIRNEEIRLNLNANQKKEAA